MRRSGSRALKRRAEALLRAPDFEARLAEWGDFPARRTIPPLTSFLCSPEEPMRWRAARALGAVVSRLAGEDPEAGRVAVRKLMWSLAEEAGGMGWGAPEAMAEIMARHQGLAREFGHVLLSYVREDGNPLDGELLRGAVWGLGRLAEARPGLLDCAPHLAPFLESADPALRGLASWALARAGGRPAPALAGRLRQDRAEFWLYRQDGLVRCRVCDAAAPPASGPGRP